MCVVETSTLSLQVVIVVSPEHKGHFEALFTPPRHTSSSHVEALFRRPPSPREMARLPPRLQRYAEKIREVGAKVELVEQQEQLGLGHAVLCARAALEEEARAHHTHTQRHSPRASDRTHGQPRAGRERAGRQRSTSRTGNAESLGCTPSPTPLTPVHPRTLDAVVGLLSFRARAAWPFPRHLVCVEKLTFPFLA